MSRKSLFPLLLALLAAGCQTAAPEPSATPAAPVANKEHFHTDPAAVSDACADRMQDLCEAMLLYYITNKQLPPTLPELQPYADAGAQLNFTCPTSGDPYVYVPGGLAAPGIHDRLVLYDLRPVHNGHRWAIVMAPAKPITMYVIPLKDSLLNAYLQGSQK
jgi:hypothetical protein